MKVALLLMLITLT